MSRRFLSALALIASMFPVFGQTAPGPRPAYLSDYAVSRFLFRHVTDAEANADRLKAAGKDDSDERHRFKKAAKLTDEEENLLKKEAKKSEDDLADFDQKAAATVKQLRTKYPIPSRAPASVAQQLHDLDTQRRNIVAGHAQNLHSSMGDDRYVQFQNFALGYEGPHIKHMAVPATAKVRDRPLPPNPGTPPKPPPSPSRIGPGQ